MNISDNAAFDISVSLFSFFSALISHPTMVFYYNILTRDINRQFRSHVRSSIIPKFKPNCILNAIYRLISSKIQTWLHYPIIMKVTWRKICINFQHHKIPGKVSIRPKSGPYILSKEIGACLQILCQSTWCIYLILSPNGCR